MDKSSNAGNPVECVGARVYFDPPGPPGKSGQL